MTAGGKRKDVLDVELEVDVVPELDVELVEPEDE